MTSPVCKHSSKHICGFLDEAIPVSRFPNLSSEWQSVLTAIATDWLSHIDPARTGSPHSIPTGASKRGCLTPSWGELLPLLWLHFCSLLLWGLLYIPVWSGGTWSRLPADHTGTSSSHTCSHHLYLCWPERCALHKQTLLHTSAVLKQWCSGPCAPLLQSTEPRLFSFS